jgi:hypothetical protein
MMLLLRYRTPKIERRAAFGRMTDCGLENQSRDWSHRRRSTTVLGATRSATVGKPKIPLPGRHPLSTISTLSILVRAVVSVFTVASSSVAVGEEINDLVSALKNGPTVGAAKIRLLSVDTNRSAVMVNISVVIALVNDDGVVAVPMITVADDVTVAISVTISVTLANRYADGADTDSHLFRASRHCAENSSYGGDRYGILNHCVLLSLLNPRRAMSQRRDRSG